jgi:uncharacterized protein YjdB
MARSWGSWVSRIGRREVAFILSWVLIVQLAVIVPISKVEAAEPEAAIAAAGLLDSSSWRITTTLDDGTSDLNAITTAMFDNQSETAWTSNKTQSPWGLVLQIDMQTQTEFDTIYIDSGDSPNYGRQYTIQSDANWDVQLAQVTGETGVTKITVPKTTARLVNIFQTGTSATPWTVANIKVYNGEDEVPVTNPENPFGPNVHIMDPSMSSADIQSVADSIFARQERNEFGEERDAILFKPGAYDNVNVKVGFYTQVSGLGQNPDDVNINGSVNANADWNNGNALVNFWRSIENLSITPPSGTSAQWAVAQAAPMRRVHIKGQLELFDFDPYWNAGLASGGYLADSEVDGMIVPASQQQWFSRNNQYNNWSNGVWNMVFVGDQQPPSGVFPTDPYTIVEKTPVIREKPYLYIDNDGNYQVFVPSLRENAQGISWLSGSTPGRSVSIDQFYIANPDTSSAASINAALNQGKNLLFTPGIYHLEGTIQVNNPNTIIMGLGFATLIPDNGQKAMTVADVDGVVIAGLLFDAGAAGSPALLEVGPDNSSQDHTANPTSLHDLFFRVGGAHAGKADIDLKINSRDVIGDHFWIWRADHGSGAGGWDTNDSLNGLVVNGEDVTIYGLFNEHHNKYQTVWNGNGGRLYFYQSEIPYEVPDQASWMSHNGTVNGYSSYKVADSVTSHEAWGLGIYSYFRDASIKLNSAIEVPDVPGVKIHHATSVFLAGNGEITHVVNEAGATANQASVKQTLTEYAGNVDPGVETVLDRAGWIASAYKSSSADLSPDKAIDSNAGTRWANQEAQIPNVNQWFQVDMGSSQDFDMIGLESGGDYPRGYTIHVSNDGSNWTDVKSGTGSASLTISFNKQTARYIRIVQTGTANSNWWALNELNVFMKQATTNVSGVTVSPAALSLKERQSGVLSAAVSPITATDKSVEWMSSDPTIAVVDEAGKVTALHTGSVTITATTNDGSKQSTAAVEVIAGDPLPQLPAGKKGISAIKYLSSNPSKLTDLGASWTYNWSVDYTGSNIGMDYVPMLWGPGAVTDQTIAQLKQGKDTGRFASLLGYNEPELVEQSNTSVADTIKEWPRLMETGLRLGSPAVAYTYDDSYAPGKTWLDNFMTQMNEKHYPVDFIALHFYPDFTDPNAVTKLKETLTAIHDKYNKPIWITEIGAIPFGTTYQTPTEELATSYLAKLIPMLEQLSFIERYAWFGDNCAHDQGCKYTTLYDSDDQLTAMGEVYKNPPTEPGPDPEPADDALGRTDWTASASSTAFGADPSFAFDGDDSRQWTSEAGQSGGEWYLLDMGETNNVSGIELDSGATATFDYARGYKIELSVDGVNWTTAATGTGSSQVINKSWSSVEARYIKITQTGYDGFWRWTINELQVYGSEIADLTPASVLGGPEAAYPGVPFELAVGVKNLTDPFSTFQVVLNYDPEVVQFDVVTNADDILSLADGVLQSQLEHFQVLGTAVKSELGQIMVIMASDNADFAMGNSEVLLSIQAKVSEDAGAGSTTIALSDVLASYEGQSAAISGVELDLPILLVDKAALNNAIAEAQNTIAAAVEGTAVGQYPAGSKAILQSTVDAAKLVRDNAAATEQEVADAISSLQAAVTTFLHSVITQTPQNTDKTALQSAIAKAQGKLASASAGTKIGQYPALAISALQQAVQAAQQVASSIYSTQVQVNQAAASVNEAILTFAASIITLVAGETQVTINDLSLLSKYYGVKSTDADWSKVQAADLFGSGEIDIRVLAAIAKMIMNEWLNA